MVKDTIANSALAVLSFIMGQYFGAECAEWLMAALARLLGCYFPILSPRSARS